MCMLNFVVFLSRKTRSVLEMPSFFRHHSPGLFEENSIIVFGLESGESFTELSVKLDQETGVGKGALVSCRVWGEGIYEDENTTGT